MRLGLALPHYDFSFPEPGPVTFERVAGYAERADGAGWHELWVSDHEVNPRRSAKSTPTSSS